MTGAMSRATCRIVLSVALPALLAYGCGAFRHHSTQSARAGAPSRIATIPPDFLDLVTTKKAFANLATVMSNGSPQVTPVWFDFDGKYIRVNSARGRVKDKNMRRDPRVALSILDPDNPYRYLAIRGRVIKVTEDGAVANINALAKKYRGMETFHSRSPDEVRVMYVIEPRRTACSPTPLMARSAWRSERPAISYALPSQTGSVPPAKFFEKPLS